MKLLSLDIATKTGVAFGEIGGAPRTWTVNLGSSALHPGARFAQAQISFRKIITTTRPDRIVVEAALAGGGGGAAARVQLAMGFRAHLMACAYLAEIPVEEVAVQTVRKHFLGNGRVPRKEAKKQTIRRCWELGWEVEDDNQADAAALWDTLANKYGRQSHAPNTLFDRA